MHSTTQLCSFEVVYGFKPITPLDLLPLSLQERANMEASKRADFVKKLHEKTKEVIEAKVRSYASNANKTRKKMLFAPGDLVWVHLRKERFPEKRKSKLMPRGDGPFKVLAKINDNAYKIELPGDDYAVSATFNVADLSPFFGQDDTESRTTPFQERGDDEDIPTITVSSVHETEVPTGSMTRARAKLLNQHVLLFLNEFTLDFNENWLLPNASILCVLRFDKEAAWETKGDESRSQSNRGEPW